MFMTLASGTTTLDRRPCFGRKSRVCARLVGLRLQDATMIEHLFKRHHTAPARSPELWAQMMPDMLGDHAESWAFGVSLAEIRPSLRHLTFACEAIPAKKLQSSALASGSWQGSFFNRKCRPGSH